MHDSKINTVIDDQIYYVYHDETYMQINLTTQPRTPERNKVTDSARNVLKERQRHCKLNKDSSRYNRTMHLDIWPNNLSWELGHAVVRSVRTWLQYRITLATFLSVSK